MQIDCNKCGTEFVPKTCPCCTLKKTNTRHVYDDPPIYHASKDCTLERFVQCAGKKCSKNVCTWCTRNTLENYDSDDENYGTHYYCKSCWAALHK